MAPRYNKKVVVEPKEEPMEVESQVSQTPKSKKNAQSKLTSFFGGATNAKNEKSESSGLKSPKKEPESPEQSPKKSGGGKKNGGQDEKQKKGKKIVVEVKKEVKEEPMSDEEEENVNPSKGAKKRPLSKTIPSKNENETNGKKKKENEKKKTIRGNDAKKSEPKTSKTVPMKKSMDLEERLAKVEKVREKAFKLSEEDQFGAVIQRATESMMTMMRTGADPQKIQLAKEALKNERDSAIKADKQNGATDPLRDITYSLCEKLETALDFIAKREIRLNKEVKKEEPSSSKNKGDADSMFAVSVGGVGKVKVEVKEEVEEMAEEIEAL